MFDIFKPAKKRSIDELALSLADEFMQSYPLNDDNPQKQSKGNRKLSKAIDSLCIRARDFHGDKHLDIYGKARLNNTLMWQLRESGYENNFVDEITKRIIISLSAPRRPAP